LVAVTKFSIWKVTIASNNRLFAGMAIGYFFVEITSLMDVRDEGSEMQCTFKILGFLIAVNLAIDQKL
jgi:hypothetical protein